VCKKSICSSQAHSLSRRLHVCLAYKAQFPDHVAPNASCIGRVRRRWYDASVITGTVALPPGRGVLGYRMKNKALAPLMPGFPCCLAATAPCHRDFSRASAPACSSRQAGRWFSRRPDPPRSRCRAVDGCRIVDALTPAEIEEGPSAVRHGMAGAGLARGHRLLLRSARAMLPNGARAVAQLTPVRV
jgi:hypothetical protein